METGGRLIDAGGYPAVLLAGRRAAATVYLPDPSRGYYRGPRFDWSGMMASLRLDGHEFFGEWRVGAHDPLGNDFAVGPACEFGMGPDTGNPPPIGYDESGPEGPFLKIGAGVRRKLDGAPYHFGVAYPLVEPPCWRVRWGASWMECRQEAALEAGWGYRYTKRIDVSPDEPALTVGYTLENAGSLRFRQTWYSHNFVRVDDRPIGRGYRIEVPFTPRFVRTAGEALAARGSAIEIVRDLEPAVGMFALVEGYGTEPSHNAVVVRGPTAALRISGDAPVHAFSVFGTGRTICPELFVDIGLAPGAAFTWSDRYSLEP
jgi:hypothetical protein